NPEVLSVALGEGDVLRGALREVAAAVQFRQGIDRGLLFERLRRFVELARRLVETRVRACARQQLHAIDRLDHGVGGAAGEGALAGLIVLGAGDHDDGDIAQVLHVRRADTTNERVAVEFRHFDVGDDDLHALVRRQLLPAGLAVFRLNQGELVGEYFRDRATDHARVVDDENHRLFRACARSVVRRRCDVAGDHLLHAWYVDCTRFPQTIVQGSGTFKARIVPSGCAANGGARTK